MSKNSKGLGIGRTQPFKNKHIQSHNKLNGQTTLVKNKSTTTKRQFDRNMLPNPRVYYAGVLKKFHPRKEQATALCPFHKESNPSFSVNLRQGKFFCFSCGARGGNVLDFHMRLRGIEFIDAVTELGAWKYE